MLRLHHICWRPIVESRPNQGNSFLTQVQVSVSWVTNYAAPYRVPVWKALGIRTSLSIGILESAETIARDADSNRGDDWKPAAAGNLSFIAIDALKLRRGENRYYIAWNWKQLWLLTHAKAVVFGGWESPVYWQLLLLCLLRRRRRVGFYESTLSSQGYQRGPISWLRRIFFAAMHTTVVPGPAAKEAVLKMGVYDQNIIEGFNAIDVRRFHSAPVDAPDDLHPGEGHRFVYVGQLIPRKRVEQIMTVFLKIRGSQDTLLIVGSGSEKSRLSHLAKESTGISFTNYVPTEDLPNLLAWQHTLILASEVEVWGLVVNEALASGLHAVVSENCGVARSVSQMRGVFVAKPDLSDLGDCMVASKNAWTGRIVDPDMLLWTPEAFADCFAEAVAVPGK